MFRIVDDRFSPEPDVCTIEEFNAMCAENGWPIPADPVRDNILEKI